MISRTRHVSDSKNQIYMNMESCQIKSEKIKHIMFRTFNTQKIIYLYRYLELAYIVLIVITIRTNDTLANMKKIPSRITISMSRT